MSFGPNPGSRAGAGRYADSLILDYFPSNPNKWTRVFRVDIGEEFYWDGIRWLSTHTFPIYLHAQSVVQALAGSTNHYAGNPWWNQYDTYVLRGVASFWSSIANRTANYFTAQFSADGGAGVTLGSSVNSIGIGNGVWEGKEVNNINTVVPKDAEVFAVTWTETGTATHWCVASLYAKVIGPT